MQFLKPYFDINNKYVINKIKYILLPFLYKGSDSNSSNNEIFEDNSFREKIEFADLYIPTMSFITYILLIAFNSAFTEKKE